MMREPTIIHVVGNRPQFIKLAVLYDAIAKHTSLKQFIVHTGQHSSSLMSDIFFNKLSIPAPDVRLEISEGNAAEFIGKASAKMFSLLSAKPENVLVMVYGDTNSTLAAAIAARRSQKILLHFESGVRTNDSSMPEEINRILTDRISSVHYCCTELNKKNLLEEGYGTAIPSEVLWTGDLMLDAFMKIREVSQPVVHSKNYIACTIHRAGNITGKDHLQEIVSALNRIHEESEVVIPMHPHTEKRIREFGLDLKCTVLEPLSYQEMKRFLSGADYVITDSGGACREAFFTKKRSLIIMASPFWPEIVNAGAALNCKPDKEEIYKMFCRLPALKPAFDINIFGDGNAAQKIANHLTSFAYLK